MSEKEVVIHSEKITLAQLLKKLDFISSGGEAKFFLAEAKIYVNGEPDNRRGRKLYVNDRVTIHDQSFVLKGQ